MKDKIAAVRNQYGYVEPFILLGVLMLFMHIGLAVSADDTMYINVLNDSSLKDFLNGRYYGWSSRLLIETVLVLILHIDFRLWELMDVFVIVWLCFSLSQLLNKQRDKRFNYICVGLFLCYPINTMLNSSAAATTLNYLWPLLCLILAVLPVAGMYRGEKISWNKTVIGILALFFAGNHEQAVVILLAAFLVFLLKDIFQKRFHGYVAAGFLISLLSLLFILQCPGNANRMNLEIGTWFCDYEMLSVFKKIEIGTCAALKPFLLQSNITFGILLLLIVVIIWTKSNISMYRFIGALPFVVYLLLGGFGFLFNQLFPGLSKIAGSITEYGMISITSYGVNDWISFFVLVSSFFCIVLSILIIYEGNLERQLLVAFIFLIGTASKMILSFSPTVWASGERTTIFMHFAMVLIILILIKDFSKIFREKYQKKMDALYVLLLCTGGAVYLSNLLQNSNYAY